MASSKDGSRHEHPKNEEVMAVAHHNGDNTDRRAIDSENQSLFDEEAGDDPIPAPDFLTAADASAAESKAKQSSAATPPGPATPKTDAVVDAETESTKAEPTDTDAITVDTVSSDETGSELRRIREENWDCRQPLRSLREEGRIYPQHSKAINEEQELRLREQTKQNRLLREQNRNLFKNLKAEVQTLQDTSLREQTQPPLRFKKQVQFSQQLTEQNRTLHEQNRKLSGLLQEVSTFWQLPEEQAKENRILREQNINLFLNLSEEVQILREPSLCDQAKLYLRFKEQVQFSHQLTEQNRTLHEQNRTLHEQNRKLFGLLQDGSTFRQIRGEVQQNPNLRPQNRSIYDQNTNLTVLLRGATDILPLWLQLFLLFLAGFFSYEPPIWMNFDKALRVMGCRESDPTNSPPSTRRELCWLCLRLAFYSLMFLVDFTDAIVDFWVSIRETLELASDSDNVKDKPNLIGYAIVYFLGTAISRTLGGLLALFYHRIDESDREVTYLLVELMILTVEDGAGILFICAKINNNVDLTQIDRASMILTAVCFVVFLLPTLCHYNRIKEALPPSIERIGSLFLIGLFVTALIVGLSPPPRSGVREMKTMNIAYSIMVLLQLYMMCHWVHYLRKKEKAREQKQLETQQQWEQQQCQEFLLRLECGDPIPMTGGDATLSSPPGQIQY